MFNWYRISMCFTCFSCQFVFNKRFLKKYCLSVHSFFLVSFASMYTTLKIISRKFLGVSLIWTFFSHVGAIFFWNSPCPFSYIFWNKLELKCPKLRGFIKCLVFIQFWYLFCHWIDCSESLSYFADRFPLPQTNTTSQTNLNKRCLIPKFILSSNFISICKQFLLLERG